MKSTCLVFMFIFSVVYGQNYEQCPDALVLYHIKSFWRGIITLNAEVSFEELILTIFVTWDRNITNNEPQLISSVCIFLYILLID